MMFNNMLDRIKKFYKKFKKDYLVNFVSVIINEIYFNYIIIFYYNYKLH